MSLVRKKRHLLKILYYLISLPFLLLALFFLKINYRNIQGDLYKVFSYINKNSSYQMDDKIIRFLIYAEDHRFNYHIGIDPIAILRALYVYILFNKYQGASTIEQQFIRTVTNRYERTKKRKMRELLLALLLCFYVKDKYAIARSYIHIAFYGSGLEGIDNFLKRKNLNIKEMTDRDMLYLVSRLKYPEPLKYSKTWNYKINARIKYIKKRYNKYS